MYDASVASSSESLLLTAFIMARALSSLFHSITFALLSSLVTCLSERSISCLCLLARTTFRTSFCETFANRSMFLTQPVEISDTCKKPLSPEYWSRFT